MDYTILILLIAGAFGALTKDILKDNKLQLPKFSNGELFLGCIGGLIIGGITGYLVDGSLTTAFLAGYAGTGVIEGLTGVKKEIEVPVISITESLIKKIAKEKGVDPELAERVAKCESSFNYKAININKDGSKDRGLFQINDKHHPEVSDEEAFDPIFATEFFCKAFKEGNISWWSATKKCWEV